MKMRYLKYYESFIKDDVKQLDDAVVDRDSLYPYEDNKEICITCEKEKDDDSDLSDDIMDLEEQENEVREDVNSYETLDQQDEFSMIKLKFEQDFGRMPLFKLQNTDNDEYLRQELTKIADEFFETNDFDESYKNEFVKYLTAEWAHMYANNIQPAWDKGVYYKKTIM